VADDAADAPATTCPVCGERGEVVLGGALELSLGSVAILVESVPQVRCALRHDLAPEAARAAAMAATEASIPRARGRLFRGDTCGTCRAVLTMPPRRSTRVVTVEGAEEVPVFTLRFDLPAVRCTECGVEQLPTRSQEDLVVAVPAVFERGTAPR
jgi:hypothetical protein